MTRRVPSRPRLAELTPDSMVYVGTDNTGAAYICAEPLVYIRLPGGEPPRVPPRMTFREFMALPNVDPFYREHYAGMQADRRLV